QQRPAPALRRPGQPRHAPGINPVPHVRRPRHPALQRAVGGRRLRSSLRSFSPAQGKSCGAQMSWPGASALGCECPPASAFGRHLLLYFAPKDTRPRLSNLRGDGPKAKNGSRASPASLQPNAPTQPTALRGQIERTPGSPASLQPDVPARAAGLRGEIKEEAFAAGGCRGTFAPKACRPCRDPSGRRDINLTRLAIPARIAPTRIIRILPAPRRASWRFRHA